MADFVWGPGGQKLTPDQVEKLRVTSALAARRGTDTSPVAHWSAGLARLVDAYGGYRGNIRADEAEEAGMSSADTAIQSNPVTAALLGGDMTAPQGVQEMPASMTGMAPQEARATPGADVIRAGLIERGLPGHVADAFVMNFQDESGLNPGINEQNPLVEGSRGGFGLAQWTGPRRRALEEYAQQRGTPVSDVDTQLDFLMTELQGPESSAAQSILSAQDTPTAAAAIVNKFLRPAEEHRARRESQYLGGAAPSGGGSAPSSAVAALIQAQSNPWVQKKYGPAIEALMGQQMQRQNATFEQQLRQQDPMYQAQLAQMTQQQAPKPIEVGGVLLDPTTYEPIFDSRTPEGQFRPLSPDEATQMGLPPDGAYQIGPDGKISQIGSGGVNVSVNTGADESEFAKALGKGRATTYLEAQAAGNQARRRGVQIEQLAGALQESPQGFEALAKQRLGEYGVKTEGLDKLQTAQALISQLVPEQRPPGSGVMSDADLALYKQSLPRLINTREGNQLIIDGMRAIQQYDAQIGDIANRVISGEISADEGDALMAAVPNPMEGWNNRVDAIEGEAEGSGTVAVPQSREQFEALPSGARFRAPDGSIRIKP